MKATLLIKNRDESPVFNKNIPDCEVKMVPMPEGRKELRIIYKGGLKRISLLLDESDCRYISTLLLKGMPEFKVENYNGISLQETDSDTNGKEFQATPGASFLVESRMNYDDSIPLYNPNKHHLR